ncbi:MAG TPA: cyclic nucleotide-binding domain-containing protein, partial [Anaerolineales bacterium]|nr:cyclic nucleotide-binding domain-containing protein [Anaerolineales bacterium]
MPIEISERVAFLRKIHLFYGLDDEELTHLAQEVEELSVPQGEVIVKQDSLADQFYMIYDGHVRIVRKQDGKEVQLVQLVKDDYFGEMALVSNRRRSATATALKDTSLLILSRDDFRRLFRERRDLSYNLAVALQSRRLAQQLRFKWLRADEVVYFLARKHWIALFPKILIPFMILFASAGFGFAYFKVIPHFIVAFAAVGLTLAALGWLGWIILDWGNDYYVVTNRRVVWLEKVIGIYDSRQESPLHMIVSVGVEMSQLGRILDYGNVIVRTYVGRLDFAAVNHPQ